MPATAASTATSSAERVAPAVATTRTRDGARLEFLDALRGVAVLLVVVQHVCEGLWRGYERFGVRDLKVGEVGVVLFFACSGFIIPASLERHGSLASFWVGRAMRLLPMYWIAVGLFLLAAALGVHRFEQPVDGLGVAVNLTMLQAVVGQPLVFGASWSLGYELTFYLLCSVLLLGALHRRSPRTAVLFLLAAVAAAAVGPGPRVLAALAGLLLVAGLAWTIRSARRRVLVVVLAVPLVPLVLNRYHEAWFNLLLFATMFVGTVLYRWVRGDVGGRVAAAAGLALSAVVVLAFVLNPAAAEPGAPVSRWLPGVPTFLLAFAVFAGGLALRRRQQPAPLLQLGRISYSVYVLHGLALLLPHFGSGQPAKVAWGLAVLALSVAAASVTYRWVEQPAVRLGRHLDRRLRDRARPAVDVRSGANAQAEAVTSAGSSTPSSAARST